MPFHIVLGRTSLRRQGCQVLLFGALLLMAWPGRPCRAQVSPKYYGDLSGAVADSANGNPLAGSEIEARQDQKVMAVTTTDEFGRYILHHLPAGSYQLTVECIGYKPDVQAVQIQPGAAKTVADFRLAATLIMLQTITVTSTPTPVSVNIRNGDQVFKQNDYHGAPTATTSQILQQSIAGAVRAPTGEVHIRGQHAEYTYYVDGVPVPSGISGSLNELFDPSVVDRIEFQTGSWDAEYGNKNAAIINVATRVPEGPLRLNGSVYGGNYDTNGESLSGSGRAGRVGIFLAGSRQATDLRSEPVLLNPASGQVENFHNHGEDLYGFGKISLVPTANDLVNLDLDLSQTKFDVPYDSTGGIRLDDHQTDVNGFENLGWRHRTGDPQGAGTELFAALFNRHGTLRYAPGAQDVPQFIFYPDTTTAYNVRENRSFNTTGLKLDYAIRRSEHLQFKTGVLGSLTRGHEDFSTLSAAGGAGPASNSSLTGSDAGAYVQSIYDPRETWEIRPGIRYDRHAAPFAPVEQQVSPRLRVSYLPTPKTTAWVYYGRLFVPTNVEDLRAITSDAQGGVVAQPTIPERDNFYEAGLVHRFPVGLVWKLSAYHKDSSPGVDDNTVPGTAITTSVNISNVHVTGLESVLEVRPAGPVSGYLNAALSHAYGHSPITGGFFPTASPPGYFDLDHDERLALLGTVQYSLRHYYASATGIYGSGLTNGKDPDASYGTGLFDFDRSIKVAPSFIVDASAGYTLVVGNTSVRPEIFVDNLFDRKYILKGAFFSGESVGKPRTIELRFSFGNG